MNEPTVFIVDDDAATRDVLSLWCKSAGLHVECFDSATAYLAAYRAEQSGCLLLDVSMPEMTGPQLQEKLVRNGNPIPIIYLTAYGDIPMTVHALKAGAVDFLTKPVKRDLLVERVRSVLTKDAANRQRKAVLATLCERLAQLTERQRQIMLLAVEGDSNKAIAKRLGISHRTVELHRSRIMQKTGATNVLELAKLVADCGPSMENIVPRDFRSGV